MVEKNEGATSENKKNSEIDELKEQGNIEFKACNYRKAVNYYTKAIDTAFASLKLELDEHESSPQSSDIQSVISSNECVHKCYNNRAQCNLKLEEWEEVLNDTNKVLASLSNDAKALFRRSQAYKELNKLEDAMLDARRLMQMEPKNPAFIQHIQLLTKFIQIKSNEMRSTRCQAQSMLETVSKEMASNTTPTTTTTTVEIEEKLTALNNLIVLSREDAGAKEILAAGGLKTLLALLKKYDKSTVGHDHDDHDHQNHQVKLAITRIIASMVKGSFSRAKQVFNEMEAEVIASLISDKRESISTAASLVVQNMIFSITDLHAMRKQKKQIDEPFDFSHEVQTYIDEIFRAIVMLIMDPACSGYGRDNCIDLCLKFVDRANGCGWTSRFIVFGIPKLLRVACTVPDLTGNNPKSALKLTEHSKMHVACCLSAVYDDTFNETEKQKYQDTCNAFVVDLLAKPDFESKLRAIACIGVILQGPFEVGMALIVKNNLIQLMLELADSEDPIFEKVAIEAVIYSASKKDKATGILSEGIDILKRLYQSKNQSIKVRALVGLCKLASCKGSDTSVKLFADGSIGKLEKAARNIICSKDSDYDSKKWACDGLAYLTLDPDVKEALVEDTKCLQTIYEMTKKGEEEKNMLFSIATIFSNVSNAQPVTKPSEEMIKIAEYAKHHIPETNEKDTEHWFKRRRQKLIESGISQALVTVAKHESDSCRELIASTYLVLAEDAENRGKLVAAGGGKALLPLALKGTDVGKSRAGQALSKITISINPTIAFPGQRVLEVVRPLMKLLSPEKTALENFEALMAITNLAGVDASVRKRIVKEEGISNVEQYMFDDHPDLRRAATQVICNLVGDEDVTYVYEKKDNDRIKLLVLYCGESEDDLALNRAAAGTLAQLTDTSLVVAEKIVACSAFVDVFKQAACVHDLELQFRIFYILRNIMQCNRELSAVIAASELMDVIVALTRLDVEKERLKIKAIANDCVKKALEHKLIKPTVAGFRSTTDSDEEN